MSDEILTTYRPTWNVAQSVNIVLSNCVSVYRFSEFSLLIAFVFVLVLVEMFLIV